MNLKSSRRLKELKPYETLKNIGIKEDMTLFDYGAGTGAFTMPAATLTNNDVYAYDINNDRLEEIKVLARSEKLHNIKIIKEEMLNTLDANTVDIVLLVTVFHEIEDRNTLFEHFDFLLKEKGKITVIEFHKKDTPMGPPISHRVSSEDVIREFSDRKYRVHEEVSLGDNYYALTFTSGLLVNELHTK